MPRVKLTVGFIFNDPAFYSKALNLLKRRFGNIDLESNEVDFSFTDYYNEEFGSGLKRRFVSFEKLLNLKKIERLKNDPHSEITAY